MRYAHLFYVYTSRRKTNNDEHLLKILCSKLFLRILYVLSHHVIKIAHATSTI